MNTTFALGNGLKVIDLTKPLDPKTESRRCHLIRYNTGGPIPDFHTAMDLTSHLTSRIHFLTESTSVRQTLTRQQKAG